MSLVMVSNNGEGEVEGEAEGYEGVWVEEGWVGGVWAEGMGLEFLVRQGDGRGCGSLWGCDVSWLVIYYYYGSFRVCRI